MNNKRHRTACVLLGIIFLASLLTNLVRIMIHNPKYFVDMFKSMKEVGLPWIPYISITTIICSAVGAIGLIKYREWGFYGIYLAYITGFSMAWIPFFPGLLPSGVFNSIIMLIVLCSLLGFLIQLHISGKKRLYFRRKTNLTVG
jgi:hypothetical protein